MSTAERPATLPLPPLIDGERLDQPTFHARYEAMPEGSWAELVDGVVHMSPLRRGHAHLDGTIITWMSFYARRTPGLDRLPNATTKLGIDAEVQPDSQLRILEECGGQSRLIDDYVVGPPELVVEIGHSSRSYDLGVKKEVYERSGVLEYLFVGAGPDEVTWFARRDGLFKPLTPAGDGTIRSEIFPGLWLDPIALHDDDLDALIATLDRGLASPEHAAFVATLQARRAGR